jgi:hypothetical protein
LLGYNRFVVQFDPVEATDYPIKPIRKAQTTPGYLISADFAPFLTLIFLEAISNDEAFDVAWQLYMPIFRWWGFDPPLIRQRPTWSDIERKFVNYST